MYDVNYFIEKFEAINEHLWCERAFKLHNQYCANGHCGITYELGSNSEARALIEVFKNLELEYNTIINDYVQNGINYSYKAAVINDGGSNDYQQPTPKQRILAALYDIRDKELSEANVTEANKLVNTELVS